MSLEQETVLVLINPLTYWRKQTKKGRLSEVAGMGRVKYIKSVDVIYSMPP